MKNSNDKKNKNDIAKEVIDYLNDKTGRKFRHVEAHLKTIRARLNEGYTRDDFFKVIDYKVREWAGNRFQKYLVPGTLFIPSHFDNYLNQANYVVKKPIGGAIGNVRYFKSGIGEHIEIGGRQNG